jgi:uncharacterized protein
MSMFLRDVEARDLDTILAINNNAGESILPIDGARMARLVEIARYFKVAEVDGAVAGFLIAMTPEADYDSPNFRWFKANYAGFVYIDRVVITPNHRRSGVGRLFYADILSFAEIRQPLLVTEVFVEPRDDVSMLFFGTQGFSEVGQQAFGQQAPGKARRVSLMCKQLDDVYNYVREHYLQQSDTVLPDWAWRDRLSGRSTEATLKLSA